MKSDTFIVIPVYNEEKKIGSVLKKLLKQKYEVVVVDDGSTDKTLSVCVKTGATVLRHIINMGKGAAAKTGCDYAFQNKAKIIVLMDGDGQHKPEDVPRILEELKKTNADIVFSYRKMNKNMPIVMKFGNKFISKATKLIQGINLRDTQSGFRAFKASIYPLIRWSSNDYRMESEMISKVFKNLLKYSEIKIQTIYFDNFKGTTVFDGIKIFLNILKFRFLKKS